MKWEALKIMFSGTRADLTVIPVYEGELPLVDQRMNRRGDIWWLSLSTEAKHRTFTGEYNQAVEFSYLEGRFALIGLGKRPEDSHSTRQHMHVAGLCVKYALKAREVVSLHVVLHASQATRARTIMFGAIVGANLAMPRDTQKTTQKKVQLSSVEFSFNDDEGRSIHPYDESGSMLRDQLIRSCTDLTASIRTARWWTDLGPNQKTPAEIERMFGQHYYSHKKFIPHGMDGLWGATTLGEKALAEAGMNLILAVGGYSSHLNAVPKHLRPRLVSITRKADKSSGQPPIAIIGKGVCFDSGGLQVKPEAAMRGMKTDMAAAAAVFAAISTVISMRGLTRDVIFMAPIVENMIGFGAMRPDDIYVSKAGLTVEIGHTDAEGRLILADAVAYAAELGAKEILTLATLTGAKQVALGDTAALYGDTEFTAAITLAALNSGEAVHTMPLDPRFVPSLDSDVADICNMAGAREGGSITAALFLKRFVPEGVKWAHLDIAGCEWLKDPRFGYQNKGPTGFGVATIVKLVESYCTMS